VRPRRLTLEGFGPYKRRQELDFTELDLFAISGPTGAGKSSIVDALTYALYGRIYRVGDDVKAFISLDQGTDRPRMMVALEFEVDGRVYRVVRTTGTKSPAQVQLEELRDGAWHPIEGRAKEANARIQRIVGLDFDAFTKSVVLPQNEFHRFLSGKPEERREILDQLLSLGLFSWLHQRASQEAQRCADLARELRRQMETTYADATPERAEELRRELDEARDRLRAKEAAVGALKTGHDLATELREADALRARADQRSAQARARISTLEAEVREGEDALLPLREALNRIQNQLATLVYDPTEHQRLIQAKEVASALEQALTEERTWTDQTQKGEAKLAEDEAAERNAKKALDDAEARLEQAQAALDEARRHDLAIALRSGLKPGDPCPVCGQSIASVPPSEAPHLDAAEAALVDAQTAAKQAQSSYQAAARRTAGTRAGLASARERLESARQRVEDERRKLATLLGPHGAASLDRQALEDAVADRENRRREREALEQQRAHAERTLNDHEKRLEAARGQLAEAQEFAAHAEEELQSVLQALEAARGTMSNWIDSSGRHDLRPALARGEELAMLLKAELQAAQEELNGLRVEIGKLEDREKAVREAIVQAEQLREQERAVTARGELARELAYHLRADRFPAFIREEALRALAIGGSERLAFLSSGRYALEVEKQEFRVIDHWNAGEARPVKTLSGGETFLASLALALALAERIPELAAGRETRLESLFLDEGFGALDAETLEVAGRALDALRSEERLVGVITHVEELAERLPARVRVIKDPEGSRLETM
jgi:exonuclease SbcC